MVSPPHPHPHPHPPIPKFTRGQWLQVGSAIEIANHHYEGNFELKEFKTDLVNGIFCTSFRILHLPTTTDGASTSRQISSTLEHSFLWRWACAIQTIAQRFLGSTMVRRIGSARHLSSYQLTKPLRPSPVIGAFDLLMIISVPLTGIIYATMGREGAVSICSAFGGVAGIGT